MSTRSIKAVIVDQSLPERLVIRDVPFATPRPGEVTVKVTAISLNRGETKRALTISPTGERPGWDLVGVIEDTNRVPGAPPVGSRVVGVLPVGSWAERVNLSMGFLAAIPDQVTDAEAATLPVAGLTALHGLRRGGLILGKRVLIDGASGGVGQMAIQLAAAAGAKVVAHIRREEQRELVDAHAAGGVAIGPSLEAARAFGPFDLIIESIGGSALSAAMTMLRKNGVCVTLGRSEGEIVQFNLAGMYDAPNTSLQSMLLFDDIMATEPAANGLAILVDLLARGAVTPSIGVEAPWTEIATVARQLIDRQFTGKAVLHLA